MKKFFTLLFALMAVMSVNAETEPLGLTVDDLNSGYTDLSSYDETTKVITFNQAWTPRGWYVEDADYSAYKYVVVRFAEPVEVNGRLSVQYADDTSDEQTLGWRAYYIICPLDSIAASSVKNIYFTTSQATTISLLDAYLTDAATEDDARVEAEVGLTMPEEEDIPLSDFTDFMNNYAPGVDNGDGTYTFTFDGYATWVARWFGSNLSDYESVKVELPAASGTAVKLVVQYLSEEGDTISSTKTISTKATSATRSLTDNKSNVLQIALQGNGSTGVGTATFSRIYLVRATFTSTGIKNVSAATKEEAEDDPDAPIYNLQGQRVTKDTKGILIQNGKKFFNK